MKNLLSAIAIKKAELERQRQRAPGGTANFDHSQDLELTHTSNAIEGNTLTAVETTMVIEQGITVAGKLLRSPRWTCAISTVWWCCAQGLTSPAATPIKGGMC